MIAHAAISKPKETARPGSAHAVPTEHGPERPIFDGLFLQRKASCACGGGCPSCQTTGLRVSQPTDTAEIEADEIAGKVMRMAVAPSPDPGIGPQVANRGIRQSATGPVSLKRLPKRSPETPEKEAATENLEIRRFAAGNADPGSSYRGPVNSLGAGMPLDLQTRSFFEPRFGADLSRVRVHTGAQAARSAESVSSLAYTVGSDIVFNENQYRPETETGKALIAHELVHTLQQNREIHRTPLPEGGGVETTDGGTETPEPEVVDTDEDTAPGDPGQTPGEIGTSVEKVIVCCPAKRIAFVTGNGVFIYRLHSCKVPIGSYDAGVSVVKNRVQWSIGTHEGEGFEEQAGFVYKIKKGQPNPAKLFKEQKSVPVESVAQMETWMKPSGKQCQLAFREREVIAPNGFSENLFDKLGIEPQKLWEHDIPLVQFGLVGCSASISASAEGSVSGSYGPGILSNICLNRQMSGGGIGGSAHFSLPGSLNAVIILNGEIALTGEIIGIPVAELDGAVNFTAQADAQGAIDADIQVAYNPAPGPGQKSWEFSAESSLDVKASLALKGDTHVGLEFLGEEIWGQTWNLVDSKVKASWLGGLTIDRDLNVKPSSGDLVIESGTSEMGALGADDSSAKGSSGGSKPAGKRKGRTGITLEKLAKFAEAVYNENEAQTTSKKMLAPKVPKYSHHSLGAHGAKIDPDIIMQAYNKRLYETDMSYETFFTNIAVLSLEVDGKQRYIVSMNDPEKLHSESVIFKEVEAIDPLYRGIRLLQLYTEREPCGRCFGDLVGIRRRRKQDFPVFYTIPLSRSSRINATNLMEAYGLTPP